VDFESGVKQAAPGFHPASNQPAGQCMFKAWPDSFRPGQCAPSIDQPTPPSLNFSAKTSFITGDIHSRIAALIHDRLLKIQMFVNFFFLLTRSQWISARKLSSVS